MIWPIFIFQRENGAEFRTVFRPDLVNFVLNPGLLFGCLIPSVKQTRIKSRLLGSTHFFDELVSARHGGL